MPANSFFVIDLAAHHYRIGQLNEMRAVLDGLTSNLEEFPDAYEVVGDFYLRVGEPDTALSNYQEGIKANNSRPLTYKLVVAYASERRWKEASDLVEKLLKDDPRDTLALSLRGQLQLRTGNKEQIMAAVRDLEDIMHRAPRNAVVRFRLGEAYLANNDLHNARLQFREAVKLESSFLLPKYALIRMHLQQNELIQATVLADEVLEIYPNDLATKLLRATAWIGLREYNKARADLEHLLQQGRFRRDAMFQLARLDISEKRFQQAERRLLALFSSNPLEMRALRTLAELYEARGALDKTQHLLETAIQQAPERLDLHFAVARNAWRGGDADRSIEKLNYILSVKSDSSMAHTLLGDILLQKGEILAARKHFQRATELDPPVPEAFLNLGTLLAREGKFREARPYLERTLDLAPDHPVANNNLAHVLAALEVDLDQALTCAQRAKARIPDNPDFTDTLGWIYAKSGLHDNAIELLNGVVTKNPARADYRYHLAVALARKGDESRARESLETALGSGPSPVQEEMILELLSQLRS